MINGNSDLPFPSLRSIKDGVLAHLATCKMFVSLFREKLFKKRWLGPVIKKYSPQNTLPNLALRHAARGFLATGFQKVSVCIADKL